MNKKLKIMLMLANKVKGFIRKVTQAFPITLKDCVDEDSLINMTIEGNTTQNTTTGKNLLPYPYMTTTTTAAGVTFTDNGDGSITINGTATLLYEAFLFQRYTNITLEIGQTYKLVSGSDEVDCVFYYIDANNNEVRATEVTWTEALANSVAIIVEIPKDTTINNVTIKPMLMLASETDETYEPYTGGVASPNYNYPQELQSVGERTANILPYPYYDADKTSNGIAYTVNDDGSISASGTATKQYTSFVLAKNMNLKPGNAYIINRNHSVVPSPALTMKYTDESGTSIFKATRKGYISVMWKEGYVFESFYLSTNQVGAVIDETIYPMVIEADCTSDDNLLPYPYRETSKEYLGITYTDNGDGTITLDGTYTGSSTAVDFQLLGTSSAPIEFPAGTYVLTGCPADGSSTAYRIIGLVQSADGTDQYFNDVGIGCAFEVPEGGKLWLAIRTGTDLGTVSGLTFRPCITEVDGYEPYGYKIPIVAETENLFVEGLPTYGFWTSYVNGNGIKGYGSAVAENAKTKTLFNANHTYTLSFDMEMIAKGTNGTYKNAHYGLSIYSSTLGQHILNGLSLEQLEVGERVHINATATMPDNLDELNLSFYYYSGRYVDENGASSDYDTIRFTNIKIEEADHETEPIVSNVYLKEPMNYKDVMDINVKTLTRNYKRLALGTDCTMGKYSGGTLNRPGWYVQSIGMLKSNRAKGFFTHAVSTPNRADNIWFGVDNTLVYILNEEWNSMEKADFLAMLDEQKANGTPVEIVYPLAEPITEKIIAPNIPTFKHGTTYSIATTVQPLSGTVEYYSTTKGV